MAVAICTGNPVTGSRKSARGRKSDAQRLLDIRDILDLTGATLEEKWDRFSARLTRAGFQSCGYLISRNDVESPLGHPESKLLGGVVSPRYLKMVLQNPDMQSQARPYRMLRTSRTPVTYFGDGDMAHATPSERKLATQVNDDFGIKAWALYPIHAPEKKRLYAIGWWDLEDQDKARRLWQAESGTFTLAATYFTESISALVNRSLGEAIPALSQREMECLLWAGAGKTTGEIAAVLNVADGTVEEYFKRAAKKLGATTRAQACVKAILLQIIKP